MYFSCKTLSYKLTCKSKKEWLLIWGKSFLLKKIFFRKTGSKLYRVSKNCLVQTRSKYSLRKKTSPRKRTQTGRTNRPLTTSKMLRYRAIRTSNSERTSTQIEMGLQRKMWAIRETGNSRFHSKRKTRSSKEKNPLKNLHPSMTLVLRASRWTSRKKDDFCL